ncbi:MAG TPA: SOS response-associated peptidase [Spirochaetota bacterium]|nr:SOS response-associated peptidase [Spirochaetota bacterium]
MCGRFALTIPRSKIPDYLKDVDMRFWPSPGYNIAPGQDIATILNTSPAAVTLTRWGLIPSWAKTASIGYRLINARIETLHEKPSFKDSFAGRRCLIPANGFYEWKTNPTTKTKTPYFFQLKSGDLFSFAGLWETWNSPDGEHIISSTIITTEANETISHIHHRMPLILKPESYASWLSSQRTRHMDLLEHIICYDSNDFTFHEVTHEVNKPSFNNPDAIKEI